MPKVPRVRRVPERFLWSLSAASRSPRLTDSRASAPRHGTLVGTWTLSSVERLAAGCRAGGAATARGLLVFDAAGHAFELARSGRSFIRGRTRRRPPRRRRSSAATAASGAATRSTTEDARIPRGRRPQPQRDGPHGPRPRPHVRACGRSTRGHVGTRIPATAATTCAGRGSAFRSSRTSRRPTGSLRRLLASHRRKAHQRHDRRGAHRSRLARRASSSTRRRATSASIFRRSTGSEFAGAAPTDDEARAAIAGFVSYYGSYTCTRGWCSITG